MGEQQPGLADQIERDIGEREILFQDRAVPAPFGQALAEDQRAVGETENVVEVSR